METVKMVRDAWRECGSEDEVRVMRNLIVVIASVIMLSTALSLVALYYFICLILKALQG